MPNVTSGGADEPAMRQSVPGFLVLWQGDDERRRDLF